MDVNREGLAGETARAGKVEVGIGQEQSKKVNSSRVPAASKMQSLPQGRLELQENQSCRAVDAGDWRQLAGRPRVQPLTG